MIEEMTLFATKILLAANYPIIPRGAAPLHALCEYAPDGSKPGI